MAPANRPPIASETLGHSSERVTKPQALRVQLRGDGCDRYALVIFEGLDAKSTLVFDQSQIAGIGALLSKRHPNQEHTLQLGEANYRTIMNDPSGSLASASRCSPSFPKSPPIDKASG